MVGSPADSFASTCPDNSHSHALSAAVFIWIALVGPVTRSLVIPGAEPLLVLGVGVSAAAAVFLSRSSAWLLRLGVAVAGGLALLPTQGRTLAIWLTLGLLLAAWVAQQRPPVPLLSSSAPGPGATAPVLALCGVAAWQGLNETATWQPLAPLLAASLMPLVRRRSVATCWSA